MLLLPPQADDCVRINRSYKSTNAQEQHQKQEKFMCDQPEDYSFHLLFLGSFPSILICFPLSIPAAPTGVLLSCISTSAARPPRHADFQGGDPECNLAARAVIQK